MTSSVLTVPGVARRVNAKKELQFLLPIPCCWAETLPVYFLFVCLLGL
jgi:hypothetical protein